MKYCIIVDDRVTDVYDQAPDVHSSLEIVEVADDNVQPGWIRNDVNELAPPAPVVLDAATLTAYAPVSRRAAENSYITVSGINLSLATMIQYRLALTVDQANKNPGQMFEWKMSDTYYTFTAAQVQELSAALATFLDNCMIMEKQISDAITAGTITTIEEIDAQFATVQRDY
jgi:hypothetical protein